MEWCGLRVYGQVNPTGMYFSHGHQGDKYGPHNAAHYARYSGLAPVDARWSSPRLELEAKLMHESTRGGQWDAPRHDHHRAGRVMPKPKDYGPVPPHATAHHQSSSSVRMPHESA